MTIDDILHEPKQRVTVHGRAMAYLDAGRPDGPPVVFLHGNPTHAYLWRNVIPHVESLGRCLAPDLIGMGDSDELDDPGPDTYRFATHRRFVEGFLEALGVDDGVTLVGHDWGSALAFDWARRHPGAVRGIAYMEAIVCPLAWDDWPEDARGIFRAMRGEDGEQLCLQRNVFVERILPASILRDVPEAVMDAYRAPFREPGEARRPTLTWARELPIDGRPADVCELVADYADWLDSAAVPKLFVDAEPGSILTGRQRERCRGWPHQTTVTVDGIHFLQEDSPDAIGRALADWLRSLQPPVATGGTTGDAQ